MSSCVWTEPSKPSSGVSPTVRNPGYPRFQGRNRYNSFTYPQGGYSLSEKHVTLSKIGRIKISLHRTIEGTIKTCSIKYEAGAVVRRLLLRM